MTTPPVPSWICPHGVTDQPGPATVLAVQLDSTANVWQGRRAATALTLLLRRHGTTDTNVSDVVFCDGSTVLLALSSAISAETYRAVAGDFAGTFAGGESALLQGDPSASVRAVYRGVS